MSAAASPGYMNRIERLLVHSWPRSLSQRWLEIPLLRRLGMDLAGKYVLEIGSGTGRGAALLQRSDCFVMASDIAAPSVYHHAPFAQEDATRMSWPDGHWDAVASMAVLHHIPDWRRAIAEVARVLAPGGQFAFWDWTRQGLQRWLWKTLFDHPTRDRFTADELHAEMERCGLRVIGWRESLWGDVVFGVAEKR